MTNGYDDVLKGQWKQAKGWIREQWAELTDDEIDAIDGRSEQLIGRVQERYGLAQEEARRSVNEWLQSHTGERG